LLKKWNKSSILSEIPYRNYNFGGGGWPELVIIHPQKTGLDSKPPFFLVIMGEYYIISTTIIYVYYLDDLSSIEFLAEMYVKPSKS